MDASEQDGPLLEELDEARRRIFAKCDHDPEKVFEYFLKYQTQYGDRLISRKGRKPKGGSAAQPPAAFCAGVRPSRLIRRRRHGVPPTSVLRITSAMRS